MLVRLGYVAMSVVVMNASPSKTMTYSSFSKLADREAAIRRLERIGAENLHNTLRLLKHNRAHDIEVYRMSSKLIPLLGHAELGGWDPIPALAAEFAEVGEYAKRHGMRLSFHPEHFTVLSTPRPEVLRSSSADLDRHVRMLEAMGLGREAMCNIHIGGAYGAMDKARERFVRNFSGLEPRIRERITLENDDKTFNAIQTLEVCEEVRVPMVLDVHHHQVNHTGESAAELWPRIAATWECYAPAELPPKIHVSSPKSEKEVRSHADFVEAGPLLDFLRDIAAATPRLDVMIEAKRKDGALFKLMKDWRGQSGVEPLSQASLDIAPA
jgi:UV DNA damage endonuclease